MYPFIAEHYWIEHQVLVIQIDFMTKSLLRTLLSNSGVNSLDLGEAITTGIESIKQQENGTLMANPAKT